MSNRRSSTDVVEVSCLDDARAIAHTLSTPSKMPWFGYSIPAQTCKIGSKLRQVANSVCSKCYALKGRYTFPVVLTAMWKRFDALNHPLWVEAMVFMILHYSKKNPRSKFHYFRWHDSGDLQGVWHLRKIVEICLRTPKVKYWLPTREARIVRNYIDQYGSLPKNLVVRLSAHTIGEADANHIDGIPISTVGKAGFGKQCEAYTRQGKCGPCRLCWTNTNINYPLH